MMWSRLKKTAGMAVALLGVSQVAAATLADEISLKVESKFQSPGRQPGTIEVTYTLVNTSAKPITAYRFGCTHALQSGGGYFSYVGADSYISWERFQSGEEVAPQHKTYLLPGDRVSHPVSFNLAERDGPYAGATCGVVVAIFADTSVEGDPE